MKNPGTSSLQRYEFDFGIVAQNIVKGVGKEHFTDTDCADDDALFETALTTIYVAVLKYYNAKAVTHFGCRR